jgi:hypothetical protein
VNLADSLYLICFDEHTGQPVVAPRVASLGLAGGLLSELILGGHLVVRNDLLYAYADACVADRLLSQVWHTLARQHRAWDVGTWLQFLATEAIADVRHRMCSSNLLRPVQTGRFPRRRKYLPVDPNAAAWPAIRLANQLCSRDPLSLPEGVLVGLILAVGLLRRVLWDTEHAPGFAYANQRRRALPPSLAAVVRHTEAAVGQHTLTPRGLAGVPGPWGPGPAGGVGVQVPAPGQGVQPHARAGCAFGALAFPGLRVFGAEVLPR